MKPDLEVVQIGRAQSFKAWEHGYPFHTVRWHFHPEFELHQVACTSGLFFVGDFIGQFAPGQLVLTGPNLPHNWVSDVAPGSQVPLRGRVLQFSEPFIRDAMQLLPELASLLPLLELSRRGVLFPSETGARVAPLLAELVEARGMRRVELFLGIVGALGQAQGTLALTSTAYQPDPSGFMATGINLALGYISDNLTEPFSERDLAALSKLSPSAFSRSFRRHTGMTLGAYVNRLRIHLACQLLMSEPGMPITDVCFAAGFTNLSNFNRQFLRHKEMPPSRFRSLLAGSGGAAMTASSPRKEPIAAASTSPWPRCVPAPEPCRHAPRRTTAISTGDLR